jgi:hypothetical protein
VRRIPLVLMLAAATLLMACAPRLAPPGGVAGAPVPEAAVERFLQLAGSRDYSGMGWYFGTSAGPIIQRDAIGAVEQRMYGLASLLTHDSFVVGNGTPVPGRQNEARNFQVEMRSGNQSMQVPFTTVRGPRDRWYVEQVAVDAIIRR